MKTTIVNQNDPRVLKTKATFMKAFKELLLEYDDYMSITVKELCDKANLNRKTFYLHYKQVDELFSEIQHESIEEFYNSIKGLDIFKDVEDVMMAYFNLNEYNPVYQKYVYLRIILTPKKLVEEKQSRSLSKRNYLKNLLVINLILRIM